jgi:diaminopimelate decarboxylase
LNRAKPLLVRIAEEVGTPVYVYDAQEIGDRYRRLERAFSGIPHSVHYSVKANSTLAVLSLLRELGAGAEIVSGGELERALRAGFRSRDIVFSGVGKTPIELKAAVDAGVGLINVESLGELEALGCMAEERRERPVCIGIRINPDVTTDTHPYTQTGASGMKFGVPTDKVEEIVRSATKMKGLRVVSVGLHVGSQILDPGRYRLAARKLAELVRDLRTNGLGTLQSVDLGGGCGISYRDETPLEPAAVAEAVRPLCEETGLKLVLEPGRFLVGNSGLLLTRCLYRKHSGGKEFAVMDAGMNDLMRPSLYGAYHAISVIDGGPEHVEPPSRAGSIDVVGPLCESGDFLGLDVSLGDVRPGTLLAVHDVGAYAFTMASNYNSRPRPAEVLTDGDRWAVVRERELEADLIRGERTLEEIEDGGQWRAGYAD